MGEVLKGALRKVYFVEPPYPVGRAKTMLKFRRFGRSGVSPVIATILLVAITVVLVSVIWVMVQNMFPFMNGAPKVGLKTDHSGLPDSQLRIIVESNDKKDGKYGIYNVMLLKNTSQTVINGTSIKSGLIKVGTDLSRINFTDDGNGILSAGDSFMISNMKPGSFYEFYILFGGDPVGYAKYWT
jgi:flagellin-like protein